MIHSKKSLLAALLAASSLFVGTTIGSIAARPLVARPHATSSLIVNITSTKEKAWGTVTATYKGGKLTCKASQCFLRSPKGAALTIKEVAKSSSWPFKSWSVINGRSAAKTYTTHSIKLTVSTTYDSATVTANYKKK
jgi:hypothetical protein